MFEVLKHYQKRKVVDLIEKRSKKYEAEIARCKEELNNDTIDDKHKRKIQAQLDENLNRWIECTDIWTEILKIL